MIVIASCRRRVTGLWTDGPSPPGLSGHDHRVTEGLLTDGPSCHDVA